MEKLKERAETVICHPVGIALVTLVFLYVGKFFNMFLYRFLERTERIEAGLSADITSILLAAGVLVIYRKCRKVYALRELCAR